MTIEESQTAALLFHLTNKTSGIMEAINFKPRKDGFYEN